MQRCCLFLHTAVLRLRDRTSQFLIDRSDRLLDLLAFQRILHAKAVIFCILDRLCRIVCQYGYHNLIHFRTASGNLTDRSVCLENIERSDCQDHRHQYTENLSGNPFLVGQKLTRKYDQQCDQQKSRYDRQIFDRQHIQHKQRDHKHNRCHCLDHAEHNADHPADLIIPLSMSLFIPGIAVLFSASDHRFCRIFICHPLSLLFHSPLPLCLRLFILRASCRLLRTSGALCSALSCAALLCTAPALRTSAVPPLSRTFPASCRSCISYILSFFCHCFFLPNFSCLFSEPVTHIRLSYHFSCFFATIPKHFRHNIPSVPILKHLHTAFTRPSLRASEALPQPPYPYHNTDNFRDDHRRSHVPLSPQVLYRRQTICRSFHH